MDHLTDSKPSPKVDSIIADITQLMDEAEQMLSESTSHHAEPQVALLQSQSAYESVPACFTALCASTSRTLAESARRTDQAIRTNPYRSLLITLGVGLFLGMAFTRRRA